MSLQIAIACGGTGGHVMPGLAAAAVLQARGHTVTLWLTGNPVEDRSAASWNGPVERVPAAGFPTSFSLRGVHAAWKLWRAFRRCRRRMRGARPDVLLAMGSYASVGPVWAARRLGVPYLFHEANVQPGRAVRWFARGAVCVASHFEETRYFLRRRRIEVTGMPLRAAMEQAAIEPGGTQGAPFTVLIMGGSHGAHVLNDTLSTSILALAEQGTQLAVIHLTGTQDHDVIRARYEQAEVAAEVHAFQADMAPLYRRADLAVCRAGASTCAELSLFGVPALLVPYPHAANDHQTANARALERAGAVDVVPEYDLSVPWLVDYLAASATDQQRRARMRKAQQARARPRGAERLADLVEQAAGD